ncbi:MAG: tRNA glutamyl-Q(34) synthetase GluQRS [Pseudomonadota bacterium]
MTFRTRFAPSSTGPLHLGHAYSALLAQDIAHAASGDFLLRIEDIDQSRFRPHWEHQIYDDLTWLGLRWPSPVMRQSERTSAYNDALDSLWHGSLLFPCTCSRRDIQNAMSAPQEGMPLDGPDGLIYPGTCNAERSMERTFPENNPRPTDVTLRLDMRSAVLANDIFDHRIENADAPAQGYLSFHETGAGPNGETGLIEFTPQEMISGIGDIVLARNEMGTSYHLSVVLDDAAQGITHVVRGQDLFEATKIHVLLQRLLGLPTPVYHHHRLIRDETGKRLAKRDDARSIATYRAEGKTADDIRIMVGL